tara:strand:+ start:331 stop:603 length:273 start_codon:yes stop_codon:yes gene_type:complete
MIKLAKISEGFYKATNIVSEHEAYIDTDLLGYFRGTVEIETENGFDAVESEGFTAIESAADFIERCCELGGKPVIFTTNFDDSPMIEETV